MNVLVLLRFLFWLYITIFYCLQGEGSEGALLCQRMLYLAGLAHHRSRLQLLLGEDIAPGLCFKTVLEVLSAVLGPARARHCLIELCCIQSLIGEPLEDGVACPVQGILKMT